jgi:hypothetical protein
MGSCFPILQLVLFSIALYPNQANQDEVKIVLHSTHADEVTLL